MSRFFRREIRFADKRRLRTYLPGVRRSPWPVLIGAVLIALGQWAWYRDTEAFWPGALLAGLGMLLVMAGARARASAARLPSVPGQGGPARSVPRLGLAAAGAALSVYAGWSAVALRYSVWTYLGLWAAGVALTVAGLVPGAAARTWARQMRRSAQAERRTWLLVGVLFALALVVRVVSLNNVPAIQAGDEAQFAQEAVAVARDTNWHFSPFEMGIWHHPRTVHTLMAISIKALGQTKAAARLPWALLGALTVPAVFFLAQTLAERRAAWAAALFMVTFPVHMQFSRTGMDMTGDPLFAALALGLLARALRRGSPLDAALAGAAGGLTQYFYFAGRIVPLVLAVYGVLMLLRQPRHASQRMRLLAIGALVFAVTVFPYFYAAYRDTERSLTPRLNAVGVWQTEAARQAAAEGRTVEFWVNQVRRAGMAYVQVSDESDVYGRYGALLGWFAGVPFLVGVALAIRRWRSPDDLIPVIWAAGTATLGGALLIDPPHYPRYISATPALAVLVGMGLVALGTALARALSLGNALRQRAVIRLQWTVPLMLAAGLAAINLGVYVVDYLPRPLLYGERTVQLNEIAAIMAAFDGAYSVHTFSAEDLSLSGTDIIRYQTPENAGVEYTGAVESLPGALQRGWHAFVIAPARLDEVSALGLWLPGGEAREYLNPRTGRPLVYVYVVEIR